MRKFRFRPPVANSICLDSIYREEFEIFGVSEFIDIRRSLYIIPLLKVLPVALKSNNFDLKLVYLANCIISSRASIVITGLDNSKSVWLLKELADIYLVIFQNGFRSAHASSIFSHRNILRGSADLLVLQGKYATELYSQFDIKKIVFMSLRMNLFLRNREHIPGERKNPMAEKKILVLFQMKPEERIMEYRNTGGGSVSACDLNSYFIRLVYAIWLLYGSRYQIEVLGKSLSPTETCKERAMCQQLFGGYIGYSARADVYDTYDKIVNNNLVVALDSTMLFELLGAGVRVGHFGGVREPIFGASAQFCGGEFGKEGVFWSSTLRHERVKAVVDFCLYASESEWFNATHSVVAKFSVTPEQMAEAADELFGVLR